MGLKEALVRLDGVVVPRLARGAARTGRTLRRWRDQPMAVLAVAGITVVAGVLIGQSVGGSPKGVGPPTPVRVGVGNGSSIPDYLSRGRSELDQLAASAPDQPTFALVSLNAYLTPVQVAAVVDGMGSLTTVAALARVPLAHRQTTVVRLPAERIPADLVAGMVDEADRKSAEAAGYAARATASPDAAQFSATSATVAAAEADAYRGLCACIYALVVRGQPAALIKLAGQAGVRGVDPAPEVISVGTTVFVAPLPDQSDLVTPPEDGP